MEYPEHIEKKGREERVYFDNAFEQAKSESKIVSVKTAKTWAREWVKNARCAKEAELAAVRSELEQENKRLALQVEIISGAYETSKKRVKELEIENTVKKRLEAEYASLLGVCKKIALEESSFKRESYILDLCNILDEF